MIQILWWFLLNSAIEQIVEKWFRFQSHYFDPEYIAFIP